MSSFLIDASKSNTTPQQHTIRPPPHNSLNKTRTRTHTYQIQGPRSVVFDQIHQERFFVRFSVQHLDQWPNLPQKTQRRSENAKLWYIKFSVFWHLHHYHLSVHDMYARGGAGLPDVAPYPKTRGYTHEHTHTHTPTHTPTHTHTHTSEFRFWKRQSYGFPNEGAGVEAPYWVSLSSLPGSLL